MATLVLDPAKSRVRVHTFAEGLFARLAHDLELECRGLTGTAEQIDRDKGSATLEAPIERIEVGGTLKDGRVDPRVLKPEEQKDILEKMRRNVFHTTGSEGAVVRIEATLEAPNARVRIVPPNGRAVERSVKVRVEHVDAETRVFGLLEISLSAIGSDPVKGPVGAFRVKDRVEVVFDVVFKNA